MMEKICTRSITANTGERSIMKNREDLEAERAELVAKNEAATSWGAAVGARSERIKEIDRALAVLDQSRAPAPQASEPDATFRLLNLTNELVTEAFMADWHDPDGTDKGVREIERIKKLFIEKLNRFACDEIKLHLARSAASTVEPEPDDELSDLIARKSAEIQERNPGIAQWGYRKPGDLSTDLTTLCDAVMADVKEAKRRLDADIPIDAPVHPVSAFLTGIAIHVGKARAAIPAAPTTSPEPDAVREIGEIWQELLDKDDRTSPAEYPEMVLISFDELAQIVEDQHMRAAALLARNDRGGSNVG